MRALLLSSLIALSAVALGQSPLAVAQKLVAAERKASLARDAAWYEKNETTDYVQMGKDGRKTTKAQADAIRTSMGKMLMMKSLTVDVLGARMVGQSLVFRARVHAVGTLTDPQGKIHSVDLAETLEDTWTKVGGDWRKRLERIMGESGKMDGKAMPSMG